MASSDALVVCESPPKGAKTSSLQDADSAVSCLADTLTRTRWGMQALGPHTARDLSETIGDVTTSSAFSAVDAPSVAMSMICRELDRQFVDAPHHQHQIK